MSNVNLKQFQFDYDLTFAMTTHFSDGRAMSRFGSRDVDGPNSRQTSVAIETWLKSCLESHKVWNKSAPKFTTRSSETAQSIMDVPAFTDRLGGKKPTCVHCHSVFPALRRAAMRRGEWQSDDKFVYPDPSQVGLTMNPINQTRVTRVEKGSAAESAGLKAGDNLRVVGNQRVHSIADVQHALHFTSSESSKLSCEWERNSKSWKAELVLGKNWKVSSPWQYSWRPMKWELSPAPGFGGASLSAEEKKHIGLKKDKFAMRVDYLVDWGPRSVLGKNAKVAGLRKGDIVVTVDGKSDFRDSSHFHSWIRLKCKVGQLLKIKLWRKDKFEVIRFPLIKG